MDEYREFIETYLTIIDKTSRIEVPFNLNNIQLKFLEERTGRDIVLKARQQGFSSLILAMFSAHFILEDNSVNVVIADIADNAKDLLARVKSYLESYTNATGVPIRLKYNSKYELENEENHARYIIGTSENVHFGRSKTITNLHMSEAAFYMHLTEILAAAGTALVPHGNFIIETTANGYNEFREFWQNSVIGETGFKALFYRASDFYDTNFLRLEAKRLGKLYRQEYPETPEEAFLTSGDMFFDQDALEIYMRFIDGYEKLATVS